MLKHHTETLQIPQTHVNNTKIMGQTKNTMFQWALVQSRGRKQQNSWLVISHHIYIYIYNYDSYPHVLIQVPPEDVVPGAARVKILKLAGSTRDVHPRDLWWLRRRYIHIIYIHIYIYMYIIYIFIVVKKPYIIIYIYTL